MRKYHCSGTYRHYYFSNGTWDKRNDELISFEYDFDITIIRANAADAVWNMYELYNKMMLYPSQPNRRSHNGEPRQGMQSIITSLKVIDKGEY